MRFDVSSLDFVLYNASALFYAHVAIALKIKVSNDDVEHHQNFKSRSTEPFVRCLLKQISTIARFCCI